MNWVLTIVFFSCTIRQSVFNNAIAMNVCCTIAFCCLVFPVGLAAGKDKDSTAVLRAETRADTSYETIKERIVRDFAHAHAYQFGEKVRGVYRALDTDQRVLALTLDGCNWKCNSRLIEFLRKEKIQATLFVSGLWIDANPKSFLDLAGDSLFEIENHGLLHRICSLKGKSTFGVRATRNVGEVDEMELNVLKIRNLTGRRPLFFRPGASCTDNICPQIAERLGMKMVNFSINAGDAAPYFQEEKMKNNIVNGARPGGIILMHFNHPDWHEEEALELAVPVLREKGYRFVKLKDYPLK